MSANALLLWMSARGAGSWQQFRAAVEELHLDDTGSGSDDALLEEGRVRDSFPLYQALRLNLQRLGHAEFFTGAAGNDWRVTPGSLALTQHRRGFLGVVAGARSSNLLRRLESATNGIELETISAPGCPDQVRMFADDIDVLRGVAERVRLLVQQDAPGALLMSLPPVDDPVVRRRTDLPRGADWRVERFTVSNLRWKPATRNEAGRVTAGLFRFSFKYQHYVLFCSQGVAFQIPSSVGKYLLLRRARRRVLRYDANAKSLSVSAACRPPFLIERALVLCSGLLPSFDAGTAVLTYNDVSPAVAGLSAALLRQEIL